MKINSIIIFAIFLFAWPSPSALCNELTSLMDQVEILKVSRNEYTLGKALTDKQKTIARRNTEQEAIPGTWKFKHDNLHVVADRNTGRVLILYEQYEKASKKKIRDLIGSLFLEFGKPTVMAHDKIIYWAFDSKGKVSEKEYEKIKDAKKKPLRILATVKLNSSEPIMEKGAGSKDGSIYYIISSDPVLKLVGNFVE